MHFTIQREALLKPLQLVAGVVERRQTLPVLSNVLLVVQGQQLSLTGTDLEVELVGRVALEEAAEPGEITVPARKLMDICKSLPADALIDIRVDEQKLIIKAGRSRFTLSTLPANDFPSCRGQPGFAEFHPGAEQAAPADRAHQLRHGPAGRALLPQRHAAGGERRPASRGRHRWPSSGHVLAAGRHRAGRPSSGDRAAQGHPRTGAPAHRAGRRGRRSVLGQHHIRATTGDFTFTSKLVDGKFPDYERVLPRGGDKLVRGDRQLLREAFSRTAILSNEKYRGIRLQLESGLLKIQANNPEQEEAEEEVAVDYSGANLEIGFNVSYLLDVLAVLGTEQVRLILSDANSSALLQEADNDDSAYVVMPMRL